MNKKTKKHRIALCAPVGGFHPAPLADREKILRYDWISLKNKIKTFMYSKSRYQSAKSAGFTLAEVIVSVSVMALLTAFFIGYTRQGSVQIKILKNKSEFIAMIYRARSLAVATYQYDPPECGYGIHVFTGESPVRRYVLWRDTATNGDCNDADPARRANGVYDASKDSNGDGKNDEDVEFFTLDSGIEFRNAGEAGFMSDILFIPPDPRVVRNGSPGTIGALRVVLGTPDGTSANTIAVTDYGQVEE